jgi:hypothetical protein
MRGTAVMGEMEHARGHGRFVSWDAVLRSVATRGTGAYANDGIIAIVGLRRGR